jgi:hypothetical protein
MSSCKLCGSRDVIEVLNLGQQPISNRFLHDADDMESLFPLALVQCRSCGLAQLREPVPAGELTPVYSWITYNEPERHLDQLAEHVARLPGLTPQSVVWGLSFKDDTLLRRLADRGFRRTRRLDPAGDLGISGSAGVELIQDRIRPSRVGELLARRERPQLIVARHILEHAHNPHDLLAALRELLAPGGYLVAEVPDCEPAFRLFDYTTLWEEHISYFTQATFRHAFAAADLRLTATEVYPNRVETLLVGIGQAGGDAGVQSQMLDEEFAILERFAQGLPRQRQQFAEALAQLGKTAILGAGHLACAFVQYLGLQEHVAFVVDDNPHKQGMFMPGSRLPIRGATALLEEDVRLCLLSVHPEAEEKVLQRNRQFVQRGGRFASIFMASDRAVTGRE